MSIQAQIDQLIEQQLQAENGNDEQIIQQATQYYQFRLDQRRVQRTNLALKEVIGLAQSNLASQFTFDYEETETEVIDVTAVEFKLEGGTVAPQLEASQESSSLNGSQLPERPKSKATKAELQGWLSEQGLTFNPDDTNAILWGIIDEHLTKLGLTKLAHS
mgnify:CR=1 FL=1